MWGDLVEDQDTHVLQRTSGWLGSAWLVDVASRWLAERSFSHHP